MCIFFRSLRERYYGCEISVRSDEVALLDLSSLRVLENRQQPFDRNLSTPAIFYLVVSRPYQSIVTEISTDVSCNNFSVDTVLWHEVFICTLLGLLLRTRGALPFSVSISSRHGCKDPKKIKSDGRVCRMKERKSRNEEG